MMAAAKEAKWHGTDGAKVGLGPDGGVEVAARVHVVRPTHVGAGHARRLALISALKACFASDTTPSPLWAALKIRICLYLDTNMSLS